MRFSKQSPPPIFTSTCVFSAPPSLVPHQLLVSPCHTIFLLIEAMDVVFESMWSKLWLWKTDELDGISENDYVFEIDCWQTMNLGRDIEHLNLINAARLGPLLENSSEEPLRLQRRLRDAHLPSDHFDERDNKKLIRVPEYADDGGSSGNVSRFINHGCEPDLFVRCVLSSHRAVRFSRIVMFATDSIAPMQELTYDYGYMLDSVQDPDGKIKRLPCYCGAAGCRKRLC
ncbi:hypothetical protein FNV43_RR25638 [Rhamnella rubrinervis]|uniref:Uncharacterized protein n=1 Tax=Rhamnella rubrinervis TaxID=2594499 RepID=A0A8K0DMU7_9ROSA|nr:hypothetical protein FNV43_RR25638 [Rhamnella rubrinervis]